MPKVKRSRKPPPEGFELIEPTIEELEQKMREGKSSSVAILYFLSYCNRNRQTSNAPVKSQAQGNSWQSYRTTVPNTRRIFSIVRSGIGFCDGKKYFAGVTISDYPQFRLPPVA